MSEGIFNDLMASCPLFASDVRQGVIRKWMNVASPGDRQRDIDLFVGQPDVNGRPNLERVRFCCENKSVITAHRNKGNRFDDLTKVLGSVHAARTEAIVVGTVLIGVAPKFLNVADRILPFNRARFTKRILPRLSSGDERLFDDFPEAVSKNRPADPLASIKKFRTIPLREPGMTHQIGLDFLLLVPVNIDNVHVPAVLRENPYGIDVDAEYRKMIQTICAAYRARWHPMVP